MRRKILILFLLFGALSCVKEPLQPIENQGKYQDIKFSTYSFDPISISTRATLNHDAENRIVNLYVIIFDSSGDIVYNHYFTKAERRDNVAAFPDQEHSWTSGKSGSTTAGTVRLRAANLSNGRLYIFANIHDDIFDVSDTSLSMVKTESELASYINKFNIPSSNRANNFVMSGSVGITSITDSEIVLADSATEVELERIDSKIDFKIGVIPDAQTDRTMVIADQETNVSMIVKSFEPLTWQVINLPISCKLINTATDSAPEDPDNFFSCDEQSFETSNIEEYDSKDRVMSGFSFYMFENRQSDYKHKPTPTGAALPEGFSSYHYRDKRNKTANGKYDNSSDKWEYAPENATYVKITGIVHLLQDSGTGEPTPSQATVTYYVHLGDFSSDADNYDIIRNTHYSYTVNIRGIDSIIVEIEKDNFGGWNANNEKQSGASAEIFSAQEEIYTFDAHYGQRVFKFNVASLIRQSEGDVQNLTWYVSTPFGHKGIPDKVGTDAIDLTMGMDYKWVHFLLNTREPSYIIPHGNPDGTDRTVTNTYYPNYCRLNRNWPGKDSEELMDVVAFCAFLRNQIIKYDNDPDKTGPDPSKHHIFDEDGNIYVTVFVDEYYYELDPTSNESRTSLWHEFVNKPMRAMHIMCNNLISIDNDSALILSAVTIQQMSIQTIFNLEFAPEGWGCESKDEFTNPQNSRFFNRDTERRDVASATNHIFEDATPKNTSVNNGLYNSGHMWGLLDSDNHFVNNKYWGERMDYAQLSVGTESNHFLRDDPITQTLRYTCLSRNRDEDGDGIIDKDEIKWYTAAVGQLQELYLGDTGLSNAAKLYNIEAPTNTIGKDNNNEDYYTWRSHVVSSTASNQNGNGLSGYRPQFIWAEEGPSMSQYSLDNKWGKPAINTVRCVRNLSVNSESDFDIENASDTPNSIVDIVKEDSDVFTFDFSRLNSVSKRSLVSEGLLPLDQNSRMAMLSNRFQTGPIVKNGASDKTYSYNDYLTLRTNLAKGIDPCPDGYRMPNIREMASLYIYLQNENAIWSGNNYMVCNYYSFGHSDVGGNNFDAILNGKKQYTWGINKSNITIDPGIGELRIRCVRDL